MKLTNKGKQELKFINDIIHQCWKDRIFKDQLITNPATTIEEFTGKKFNPVDNRKIIITDQTDNNFIYLNIPKKPNLDNFELTEEQLELASGGNPVLAGLAIAGMVYSFGTGLYDSFQ